MRGVDAVGGGSADVAPAERTTFDRAEPSGAPTDAALSLAAPGGRVDAGAGPSRARADADAALLGTLATKLGLLGDPEAMLALAQTWVRELRMDERESGVRAGVVRAEVAADARDHAIAEAARNAAQRKESDMVGAVFGAIAAAVSVAAGALGAIFTGGATLVGAIGLAIGVLGPLIVNALSSAGKLDAEVAMGIGIGCAVVGTVMSFGAAGAGSAGGVAAGVVVNTAKIVAAAAQAGEGICRMTSAAFESDAMHRTADATGAGMERDAALGDIEDGRDEIAAIMREFARVAEKLRRVGEAKLEAISAAASFRA